MEADDAAVAIVRVSGAGGRYISHSIDLTAEIPVARRNARRIKVAAHGKAAFLGHPKPETDKPNQVSALSRLISERLAEFELGSGAVFQGQWFLRGFL